MTRELGADTKRVHRLLITIKREIATKERCNISERSSSNPPRRHQQHPTAAIFLTGARSSCPFFDEDHTPQHCRTATTPAARASILKTRGMCFNCFRKGHLSRDCRASDRCSKCGGKHHSTLCRGGAAKQPGSKGEASS